MSDLLPTLTIRPRSALFDQPVSVRIAGLAPGQAVRLQARVAFPWTPGISWTSWADLAADALGEVKLADSVPAAGTYRCADPMGLFWSLQPSEPPPAPSISDLDTSIPLRMAFTLSSNGRFLAEETIERRMQNPEIHASEFAAEGLRGKFFAHPHGRPRPGILFLAGAGGGVAQILPAAALLASHGYSVLALGYYGEEGLPATGEEIPLERFNQALRWLGTQPCVQPKQIGAIGGSKGGELALLLGSLNEQIRAVVAIAPSTLVLQGAGTSDDPNKAKSSWTYQGQALPFVRPSRSALARGALVQALRGKPVHLSSAYQAVLDHAAGQAAQIPLEGINGPILLISGTDDGYWPAARFCEIGMARLKENSFAHPYRHLNYAKAGHSFYAPYLLPTAPAEGTFLAGLRFTTGGSAEINHRAQVDSWAKILAFFEECFPTA